MPDVIIHSFSSSPFVLQWYLWGVVVSSLLAAAVTMWVFLDARRADQEAAAWKTLAALSLVFGVPALLARLHAGLATDMRSSLPLLAYLSMAAALTSLAAAIGYLLTCYRKHQDTPDASAHQAIDVTADGLARRRAEADALDGTVVLMPGETPKPLAFLAITSGPYADTMLPLHAGTTRIGRDGKLNDHSLDDGAVSAQHLSVRFRDGTFVATDLDSINGSYVNGRRIEKQALSPNDVLQIGTTRLVFLLVPNGRAVAA